MLFALSIGLAGAGVALAAYLQHPKFGALPAGERLVRIERSPHFIDGEFQNLVATPMFADDRSFLSVLVSNLVADKPARVTPAARVPTVKTDLKALDVAEDTVIWLGHSTYFVQIGG